MSALEEHGVESNLETKSYWCSFCARKLAPDEVQFPRVSKKLFFLKLDLTSSALNGFPDLKKLARVEGASRTCLLIAMISLKSLPEGLHIALDPLLDYVVIKAPMLEWTELWVVPQAFQDQVEKAAGFGRASEPLLIFK